MRWLVLLLLTGCPSQSNKSGGAKSALPPEHAALVKSFSDKVNAALATPPTDPSTLPRCPAYDDALLLNRQKMEHHLGAKPQPTGLVGNEVMQSHLGCGQYWDEAFRTWIPQGNLKPAVVSELERAKGLTVAFCYWREELPSVFENCGPPDPSTKVMECAKQEGGKSVIDLVRHGPDGACANRIVVQHPPYDDPAPARARAMGALLSSVFSSRGRPHKDPCSGPWRVTVDDEVVCSR